jgi:hypothetical protein
MISFSGHFPVLFSLSSPYHWSNRIRPHPWSIRELPARARDAFGRRLPRVIIKQNSSIYIPFHCQSCRHSGLMPVTSLKTEASRRSCSF